jgi:uncharacterized protein (DUF362 family)
MNIRLGAWAEKYVFAVACAGLSAFDLAGCSGSTPASTAGTSGSTSVGQAGTASGGMAPSSAGGSAGLAGAAPTALGGNSGSGGTASTVVALLQAAKPTAAELTQADVAQLVTDAVSRAGGLDFMHDGQTVVLKPNLITFYQDAGEHTADTTVNGVATDWRVVKAVADLVRAKNPSGKILVMEGSRVLTTVVYPVLGYTQDNFGTAVDEFVGIEGTSCADTTTTDLEQRNAASGKQYWVNKRLVAADVLIDIPTLATDAAAGIGGAVESLAIGATPAGQYGSGTNSIDCTRTKIDQSSPDVLGAFIADYYRLRPADFVVVDGLQGLQHGPLPVWDDSGTYDYASSIMNMRLILAGKDAIAVDAISALVMKCVPDKVPFLSSLQAAGLGTADQNKITVVGKLVSEVAKPFAGKQLSICPGQ